MEEWRARLREVGDDPLGEAPSQAISKRKLDKQLTEGSPEAAGLVLGAVEEFAGELATVVRRVRRHPGWRAPPRRVGDGPVIGLDLRPGIERGGDRRDGQGATKSHEHPASLLAAIREPGVA